jgi:hypothetical protein
MPATKVADDRARPQPTEQWHHDDRRQQEDQQLMEDRELVHGAIRRTGASAI